ncbi:hypothetical protein DHEL01_v203332 [Diaporthe helianthi]|uniref:Uncharacterized protein n=1 Tax=Diaporthe helianthi TaxID=158607 RepID=A0A2P5I700_DIAHE|nr:hypothetical protein DHEL01_v203332 [Diaporthe helianthi]
MAPLFNTTAVCNTTKACAHALDVAQLRLDDFQRLSYILGSLFGIALLLFILSPLIFNLPKEGPASTKSVPSPRGAGERIQMQNLERPGNPEPEFVIGEDSDEEDDDHPPKVQASQSTLSDLRGFREVNVDGETFHVVRSYQDVARLEKTRVFQGVGDERRLAQRCVDEARPMSLSSSTVLLPSRSYSPGDSRGRQDSPGPRIGTAVSV